MEIPESALRNVPNEYQLMSSKKGAKRYRTEEIEEMLAQMVDAEDRKDSALKDVMRRIFHSFDERLVGYFHLFVVATGCPSERCPRKTVSCYGA